MRLAFLTSQLTLGGAERQLVRTAAHLAGAGAEVLVVSTTPTHTALDAERVDLSALPGLRVATIDASSRRERLTEAHRMLRGARPDVLVGWLQSATVWGPALAIAARVPTFRLAERNALSGYSAAWRRARLAAARYGDRVVANSESAATEWRSAAPWADVRHARNFPPPVFGPSPAGRGGPVRLVVVGRLVHQKGIDTAIDALALARARGLDAELTVVGRDYDDGRTSGMLADRARAAGVEQAVRWRAPDLQGVSDVRAFADVLLVPSRWEGNSNVLAEGLAAGLPVLATDAVATPSPGITFPTVPADDAEALATAMVEQAWESTSVEAGVWDDWAAAAGREAVHAWLDG